MILYAHALDGRKEPLGEQELIALLADDTPAWAHMQADHPETEGWMLKHLDYLDPIVIEALVADETRPRCEKIGDGVMLILRGVNMNEGAEPEDMVSLRLWVDPQRIVSLRRRKVRAVMMLDEAIRSGKGAKSSGELLTQLIGNLLDIMEPVLGEMEDAVDSLEEELIEDPNLKLRHKLALIRRRALHMRRHISPQREALAKLRGLNLEWLSESDKLELLEAYDCITRYIEQLDTIRERCQIVQDELATVLADTLNRNTYLLSVIAAIFLPLGFLTGLLGINVGGMPGVEDASAFTIVAVVCVVIVLLELIWFKKMRWF